VIPFQDLEDWTRYAQRFIAGTMEPQRQLRHLTKSLMKPTRKISLTRLHAINWYGYADSIPSQATCLSPHHGSGKSILMDLLQFILVGDRRLVKFNQSATGTASARDLKVTFLAT